MTTKLKKGDLVQAYGIPGRMGTVTGVYTSEHLVQYMGTEWVSDDEYDIVITADSTGGKWIGKTVRAYGSKGWERVKSYSDPGTMQIGDMVKHRTTLTGLMATESNMEDSLGVIVGYTLDNVRNIVYSGPSKIPLPPDDIITTHKGFIPRPAKLYVYWGGENETRPEFQFDLEVID